MTSSILTAVVCGNIQLDQWCFLTKLKELFIQLKLYADEQS